MHQQGAMNQACDIDLIFKITASKNYIFQLDGICYHRNHISLTVEGQWRNEKGGG